MDVMIPNKVARFLWPTVYNHILIWRLYAAFNRRRSKPRTVVCMLRKNECSLTRWTLQMHAADQTVSQ